MNKSSILKYAGVLLVGATAGITQAQITKDLVVHLPFDNNLANTRNNEVTATAVGSPSFGTGKIGSGAVVVTSLRDSSRFDYVTLGQPSLLNFGAVRDGNAVDFTVAFWCNYTNQVSDPALISNKNWNSSNNRGWGIFAQGGGHMRINTTDDTGSAGKQDTSATPVVRDGTWHHVVVSFVRSSAANVYVDGTLRVSSSMVTVQGPIDTIDDTYSINIGQDGTGTYTDGGGAGMQDVFIDDVGIWRRALSAGEVLAIYNAGLGGTNLASVPAIVNPYVKSVAPADKATGVAPVPTVSAVITDGLNAVAANSIKLTVGGTEVSPNISKVGSDTTVSYTFTSPLPTGATTATLVYGNNATPQALFTNTWSFTVAPYVTLTPDLKVAADTAKPGFTWKLFANVANTVNNNNRTEAALAGLLVDDTGTPLPNLADPNAQGVAIAAAAPANPANAPILFEVAGSLNLNPIGGGSGGSFPNDEQMPGLPAVDGSTDGIAAEALTFLELPAGLTTMGVNSDDGFKTTAGKVPQDQLSGIVVGEFDGPRGPTDTIFYLNVQEAGTYAFRTTYENGAGGAGFEWFTVKADGTKVLVNDTANGGIRAYRAATVPTPAYVQYVSPQPAARQFNQPMSSLLIVLADGTTAVNDSSVQLKIDGKAVTPSKSRQGNTLKLTYTPTGIQFPADPHPAQLTFADTAGTTVDRSWNFMNLINVVLPAPAILETFDSYTEGSVPTGWAETNFTATGTAGLDLDNLESDSYKGWVVVSKERLSALKGRIFDGPAPNQFSNGVPVTELSSGNLLYAESDVRGGSQVQFLYTTPYNLSQLTNVAIGFGSLYEQNQDNLGAIEYSIDGGRSWLPAVYYLDFVDGGGDIKLNPDGSVDAVKTFTAANGDTAVWTDNGVSKGGNYGDGILAPITQELGRFIAPRQNDSRTDGKRFEIYRLERAGKQADVRLRFSQIGTGSWYFGIDNLGFYDVPTPPPSGQVVTPVLTATKGTGNTLTISWTGQGTLLESASVNGPWTAASSQANPQTITATGSGKFYRVGP
jgi:hypothetical protein